MAIYIMMTTLTDEGRKTIKQNPGRIKEVNKEVEPVFPISTFHETSRPSLLCH